MIPPKGEWHSFADEQEQLDYLRAIKLLPKTAKAVKQFYYSGVYADDLTPCTVVGYLDRYMIVISVEGELHCIHADHLHDMQPTNAALESMLAAQAEEDAQSEQLSLSLDDPPDPCCTDDRALQICEEHTPGEFSAIIREVIDTVDAAGRPLPPDPSLSKEEQTYLPLKPYLRELIRRHFLDVNQLRLQRQKEYSSITYMGSLIARIRYGSRVSYLAADSVILPLLARDGISYTVTQSEPDLVRISLHGPAFAGTLAPYVLMAAQQVLESIPKEFDCCSRVEECSNAKQCLQPNYELRLGCGYRKIMASGRIFYGENRNTD